MDSTNSRSLTDDGAMLLSLLARKTETVDDPSVSYSELRAQLFTPQDSPFARREWQRLESQFGEQNCRQLIHELLARMATINEYFHAGGHGEAQTPMAAMFYMDYLRANRLVRNR